MSWYRQRKPAAAMGIRLFALALSLILTSSGAFAGPGDSEYSKGKKAEDQHNWDEAFKFYREAIRQKPDDPKFLVAVGRARFNAGAQHIDNGSKLAALGNLKEALSEFETAAAIDPASPAARQEIARTLALIDERKASGQPTDQAVPEQRNSVLDAAQGPPTLKPLSQAPINLKITNESKVIFETIGKLAGINVLFDPDFVTKRITVELNNVSIQDALDQTALMTKTFWKVLTANTILVIPDTAVKRREQEEQVIKTFYLSNPITPQELTEAVTAIRTLLETRRIQQINSLNAIIIRDTPDRVAIAEKIIQDIDKAKPEVVVEVSVLEVRRDKSRQLGLYPASGSNPGIQTAASYTPRGATGTVGATGATGSTGSTGTANVGNTIRLNNLQSLSTADYSITLPGASLNALMGDSNTKVLQRPEVRASDGQKATLRIGDRVPVATGSFQPGIGGVGVNPLVNTQFQYIDVGVNLDITPKVHASREISMKVRVEVSQVTGESNIGGISQPVIGQRIIDHDIRLKEGEVNILGGLIQEQTTKSLSGIPGLSQVPFLKYFFSNVTDKISEDEVLIVLTPHVVRRPDILPFNMKALDVGTEGDVHLRTDSTSPEPAPAPPAASSAAPPASSGPYAIKPDAMSMVQKMGQNFEVPVKIENATQAKSASFELTFDAGLMKLLRISSGGFLGKGGQPVAVVQRDDDNAGKTVVTLSRPPDADGVTGSGTLAILTFSAEKAGMASVGIATAGQTPSGRSAMAAQATVTIQ